MASVIIVVIIFVLLALAILFIANNGGFKSGCTGHCASCQQRCSTPKPDKKPEEEDGAPKA